MSFSPGTGACEMNSPDVFIPDIRCNLESQFLNARESTKEECMCVYARVRPVLPQEAAKGFKECIAAIDEKTVRVVVPMTSARHKASRQSEEVVEDFSFNAAFGPESGQFVFFQDTMLSSIQNFVEGQNSLIFSYGTTGSGKTYTLQGNPENPGIIPLSLRLYFAAVEKQLLQEIRVKPHFFNNIVVLSAAEQKEDYSAKKELLSLYNEECDSVPGSFRCSNSKTFAMTLCDLFSDSYVAEERQTTLNPEEMASAQAATVMKEAVQYSAENQHGVCSVWVSFVEIYNENIYDLLQPFTNQRKRLTLGEDKTGNVYIKGAREICVFNADEALKILNVGRKQLSIASTKMNYQSSRSHCIYSIRVVRVRDINNLSLGRVNRLCFCDLAGSERVTKAETTGARLKEAGAINTSLLVLGRCLEQLRMNQMGKDKRMIPFRDSKLTRIFSGFFMGQGKAVMITNASPCDYTFDETLHVLKFSALARKLLVNDTFYSDASTTLHNICNQWANTSNASFNESMESVDSDSEIIKKKDEIIEKLIQLAERLTKNQQDMADMEMRIRQEVCREYSEYSDQLIENKRIMYEELLAETKEKHKKALENKEQMYENILEGFKRQLNESVDSNEDTINDSNLHMDLEDSVKLSSGLEQNAGEFAQKHQSEEAAQSQNIELTALQSTLTSITAELEQTKQELLGSQKSVTDLNIDNGKLKNEMEGLKVQIKGLEEGIEKYALDTENYRSKICNLESKLLSTEQNYEEQLQARFNIASNLERENEELKIKAAALEEEIISLKAVREDYNVEKKNLSANINILEDKLLSSNKNYVEAKEQLKSIGALKDENELLVKQVKELKESNVQYEESIVNYKTNIGILEDKLLSVNKISENTREELQNQCNITSELEKESKSKIERLQKEIEELNECNAKYKAVEEKYKTSTKFLEDKLQSTQIKLDAAENQMEVDSVRISELVKEIEAYKNEITIMGKHSSEATGKYKEVVDENESKVQNLEQEISSLKNELSKTTEELQNIFLFSEDLLSGIEVNPEKEIIKLKKDSEGLASYQIVEKLKGNISILQQELQMANKNSDLIRKEMKVRETVSMQLEEEIDMYKQEVETLKAELSEKVEFEKISSLVSQELEITKADYNQMSAKLSELEDQIDMHKQEVETLKAELSEKVEMEKISSSLSQELEITKANYNQMSAKLSELEDRNSKIEREAQDTECKISEKIKLEEELSLVKKELEATRDDIQEKNSKLEELESQNSAYKSEIEKLKQQLQTLEKKLLLTSEELKTVNSKIQQKSSELLELENENSAYKSETEKLKQQLQTLEKELLLTSEELKIVNSKIQQKSSELLELENENNVYKAELQKLKQQQETREMELTEKFLSANKELKTVNDEIHQKSSNILELENKNNTCKLEIEKLKQDKEDLVSERMNLQEKLISVERDLEVIKHDAQQKSEEHLAIANQIDVYKVQIDKLEKNCQNLLLEKVKIEEEAENYKVKIEKLSKLEKEMSAYKHEIKKMEEDKKLSEKEKQDLMDALSTNEEKIEDLEDKLTVVNEELETAKVDILAKNLVIEDRQNCFAQLYALLEILQKCEAQATEKIKKLNSTAKSEIMDLHKQIRNKESSIEELEKALCELQEQLKSVQISCEQKLVSEKEQHEIEIKETMKLKHLVEEENMNLKKHDSRLKPDDDDKKVGTKNVNQPKEKKNVNSKGKENLPKAPSTRLLRKKQINFKELSFSSVTSSTPGVKQKSRKRVSDEDFIPDPERASKKMKPAEASKIPVKRTSRRKIQNDNVETLSPVQKITNSITSKIKVISSNISTHISSPRLTRGRKKLFNPEAPSTSRPERATKGKK